MEDMCILMSSVQFPGRAFLSCNLSDILVGFIKGEKNTLDNSCAHPEWYEFKFHPTGLSALNFRPLLSYRKLSNSNILISKILWSDQVDWSQFGNISRCHSPMHPATLSPVYYGWCTFPVHKKNLFSILLNADDVSFIIHIRGKKSGKASICKIRSETTD